LAREPEPQWAHQVVQRHGVLLSNDAAEPGHPVLCLDLRGTTLVLAMLSGPSAPIPSGTCRLQFSGAGSIFQLSGTVAGEETASPNGVAQRTVCFAVDPAGPTHFNRRSAFRVDVMLKGELALLDRDELDPESLQRTGPRRPEPPHSNLGQLIRSRKRPCIIRDLSLGGARLLVQPPSARAGQTALLDLAVARGDVLHNIAGTVVQGGPSLGRGEFSYPVRLRFIPLPGPTEGRLARLISQTQLKTLRLGVRDRR